MGRSKNHSALEDPRRWEFRERVREAKRNRFASAPGFHRIVWDSNCVELSGSQLHYTAGKAIVQRVYISDKEPGVCLPEESGI